MEYTYLFIDGGYLRRAYADSVSEWFGNNGELDFSLLKKSFDPRKIFYYDCEDKEPRANETEDAFRLRLEEQDSFFNSIREIAGCHVRLGHLTGRKENRRRQKEVDIRLAVDMMNHAARRNMTKAILLTGDRDFKPLVESLVDMGLHMEVAADPRSASLDLAYAADSFRRLTFADYHSWSKKTLQDRYPIEILTINRPPDESIIIKTGSFGGNSITLHQWRNDFFYLYAPHLNHHGVTLQHHDVDRLQLYFKLQYGAINWN